MIVDSANKEDVYRACLNDLLVAMGMLDPVDGLIDAAFKAPGNDQINDLHQGIRSLAKLIENEVSKLKK